MEYLLRNISAFSDYLLLFINNTFYPCNLYYDPVHCYNVRSACQVHVLDQFHVDVVVVVDDDDVVDDDEDVDDFVVVVYTLGDEDVRRCSYQGSPDREDIYQING